MTEDETEHADTLESEHEPKSSARILSAVKKSQDAFRDYQDTCDRIDEVHNKDVHSDGRWLDPEFDLFWASMEIIKPAIYARTPQPSVAPMFADNTPIKNTTAELLERLTASSFDRAGINEVMLGVRDDLAFTNRGIIWVTYETDDDGKRKVCIEHLDRTDFGHEPARQWDHVGYVWRRAWLTRSEMRKRFRKTSGDAYQRAKYAIRRDDRDNGAADDSKKCGVYEVWHKADNQVYWVTEGVEVILDQGEPHLKLDGFFPCPKPAYGTLRRRSLVPIPDYIRYASHLNQINQLTARIYLLLDRVKMKGLIPAGGDIGDTVEQLLKSDDDVLLIPVPAASFSGAGANGIVSWIPLAELAQAIQGLIEARGQLFEDFYQLSGISDIMRGATEAQETLGAQQLKTQYGSVRVRQKIDELQRIAADTARIVAEIAAEKFDQETMLDMSQMELPTRADIKKRIKEIEDEAAKELKALAQQAREQAQQAQQQPMEGQQPQQQPDPEQAQQMMAQAQQQIIQKYSPQLNDAARMVAIEDVMDLLRDERARGFAFEIATDSTIMTDEIEEKASRTEFLSTFVNSAQGLAQLTAMGNEGAALAGGLLKFVMAPFRVGRELNKLIDDFVEAAPELAQQAQGEGSAEKELAQANQKLAEAEMAKAQAQAAKVQADSQLKMQELERKAAEAQAKMQSDQQKGMVEVENTKAKLAETEARIRKINAEIEAIGVKAGVDMARVENEGRKTDIDEFKAVADAEMRQTDQAMRAQSEQRNAQMSERQQSFSERQAMQEPGE